VSFVLRLLRLQWAAKTFDTKEACVSIYTAGRRVLAAIHDVPLDT
jgi:hypothetical protein